MTRVAPVEANTVKGLVNILTGDETVIVNGIVGSVLTETNIDTNARMLMRMIYPIAGVKATRYLYRSVEWAFENNYLSLDWC